MVLALLCLIALTVLAGCGEDDEERTAAPPPAGTVADLVVSVDPDGRDGNGPVREAEVRCADAADSPACRAIADLQAVDFEPPPDNIACTQQYGGPDTATVRGTLRGEQIDARFSRTDGCEITRWEEVAPLLEAATR
jgi:hypothetical protein